MHWGAEEELGPEIQPVWIKAYVSTKRFQKEQKKVLETLMLPIKVHPFDTIATVQVSNYPSYKDKSPMQGLSALRSENKRR